MDSDESIHRTTRQVSKAYFVAVLKAKCHGLAAAARVKVLLLVVGSLVGDKGE